MAAIKRNFILSPGIGISADNLYLNGITNSTTISSGSLILSGGAGVASSISIGGRLQLFNGSFYTSFVSSATSNATYTLPATAPATGTSVLQSNTSGTLSWVPMVASSGSGGSGTVDNGLVNSIPYYSATGTAITGASNAKYYSGIGLSILDTTANIGSTFSGALQVAGGVGVGGTLFVANSIILNFSTSGLSFQKWTGGNYGAIYSTGIVPSNTNYSMITDGASVNFNGTNGVYFNISNSNKIQVTSNNINIVPTAASTSNTTGSLTVGGGVGIGGSLYVASATAISGVTINNGIMTGTLTGTATTSTNINVAVTNTASTVYPVFTGSATTTTGTGLSSNGSLTYVPSTGTLSATVFSGSLSGLATTSTYSHQSGYAITAGSATTSNNINVTSATTNASHPVLFTSSTSTVSGAAISSESSFVYNPSTDILSVSGLAVTSSTPSTSHTTGAIVVTGGVGIGGSLTINGDLTVNGTTTTINSVTLTVDDKNIELGSVTSPSDITAEAGGITLKGATDKFINWYTGTGWSSNESLNLASGLVYKIANTSVLSASSIGTGITNSSLTALGTITTGTWAGTALTARYGGTGLTTYTVGDLLYANTTSTLARVASGTAGSVLASAGAGSTPYYADPNVLVTSASGTTSRNVNVTAATTNSVHYLTFTSASTTVAGAGLSSGTAITANPSTGSVSATTFTGSTGTFTTVNAQGSTASTYFGNGSLVVSGGAGISGQLSFNTAALGYTGATNPSIAFIGSTTVAPITLTATSDGAILFEGSSGKLFGINNNLSSGWIFNVGDISGLPIIRANADGTVVMTEFAANVGIGLSNPQYKLHVTGSVGFTSATQSNTTTSGALIVTGGVGIGQTVSIGGRLNLWNSSNTFYTSLVSGASSSNQTYTLPVAYPGTGTSILQSDTSGTLTWVPLTASSSGTTSANVNVTAAGSSNLPHYITFITASGTVAGAAMSSGTALTYNPSTATLFATNITAITGITGTLSGFATTGRNVDVQSASTNATHAVTFTPALTAVTGSATSSDGTLVYNPSTKIFTTSGLAVTATTASISTSSGALAVSGGVGIGGSLYVTSATGISGVTINAGVITGSLTGTATTSTNINVATTNTATTVYPVFTGSASTTTGTGLSSSGSLSYVPSTGTLTATSFSGSLTGNVTGFASTGRNVDVQLATTNATHAVTFTPSLTAVTGSATSSDGTLVYNPSTKVFTSSGLAVSSTTASLGSTTGALIVSGGVGIGQSLSLGGRLLLFNGANYTALVSSASGNTTYTLPAASPATGTSVLQSTSAGVMSWISPLQVGIAVTGAQDGNIQYKSGSSLGATNSLFFDSTLLGLRVSGFPGGEATSGTSAALKVEQSVGSFNGSVNGTLIAANANTGFNGDLINLQLNAITKFRVSASGAIGMSSDIVTSGTVSAGDLTNSTSTTTGSLKVSGGAGITGNLYAGGNVRITSSTASTNSATGSMQLAGGLGISGQLSFNSASLGSTGASNPSIVFSGSATSAPITLTVLSDNTLSWEGTSGQLFAIDNNLTTGDIFSVSDISGLPIINASAGQTVSINEFGGFTRIGNGSISSTGASNANADGSLVVYGGVGITGNLSLGGVIRSGNNTFTKSGLGAGDIALDNGTFDTPAVLFYWSNNKNMGIDTYYAGSGTTKFRIVKELNESGGSELWSVDRNGLVNRSAWDVGEVIASRAYDYLALGMQSTTSIGITSNVAIGTTVYTPKSSSSYLWIEFDADYDFNNGTTADSYYATIKANNTDVAIKQQIFLNAVGGGTRSSVLFPISGRYTNSSTSGVAITVYGRRNSSDDDLRVFGNTTSGFMRIQEIGR